MMRKIFDQYLDQDNENVAAIARELNINADRFCVVRLV